MSRIDVVNDGKRTKIMVNFIKRGDYSSPILANRIAKELQHKELQSYKLTLAPVTG